MLNFFVYALGDPRSGDVYYVGCTLQPVQRMEQHLRHQRGRDFTPAELHSIEIQKSGCEPVFIVLKGFRGKKAASEFEQRSIRTFRARGLNLLNVTSIPYHRNYL